MLHHYSDILKRIPEKPIWFDSNGVPRFEPFHPTLCPNIYAKEVVLYEIACQSCGKRFLVEGHTELTSHFDMEWNIKAKALHYGDPPCWECASGATMNCVDIRTVEVWSLGRAGRKVSSGFKWRRVPELENLPLGDEEPNEHH